MFSLPFTNSNRAFLVCFRMALMGRRDVQGVTLLIKHRELLIELKEVSFNILLLACIIDIYHKGVPLAAVS